MATAIINVAASLTGGLLAAHTQRLHDAQNENSAGNQAVQAFDADLQQVVDAYNSGQVSQADGLAALAQIDQQIYSFLRSQVGKPGTAWRDGYTNCDKTCTVGCCIYNTSIHPSILNAERALQSGSGSFNVRKIFPSSYGLAERDGYSLTFQKPSSTIQSIAQNPASAVSAAVDSLLGVGSLIRNGATGGSALASNSAGQGSANRASNPLVWIILAVLGALVLFKLAK